MEKYNSHTWFFNEEKWFVSVMYKTHRITEGCRFTGKTHRIYFDNSIFKHICILFHLNVLGLRLIIINMSCMYLFLRRRPLKL